MPDRRQVMRARELRAAPTDAEKKLWQILRRRSLSGAKFRRQFPIGPYVLDFFCAEHSLAIELDGGQHALDEQVRRDALRTAFLERQGIQVMRFWNTDVLLHPIGVLETIAARLASKSPLPGPPPA